MRHQEEMNSTRILFGEHTRRGGPGWCPILSQVQDGGVDGRPGGVLEPKSFIRGIHPFVSPSSGSAWVSRCAPLVATGHLQAAALVSRGRLALVCGEAGLWWCAGARGPCRMVPSCVVHVAVMLGPNGLAVPGCPAADLGDRSPLENNPQLLHWGTLPSQELVF